MLQQNPLAQDDQLTPAGQQRSKDPDPQKRIQIGVLCVRYHKPLIPKLSMQEEFNLCSGIRRGYRDDLGRLIPDHVIGLQGQPLSGRDIRQGTISVFEHQERYLSAQGHKDHRILAAVGYGNLTPTRMA